MNENNTAIKDARSLGLPKMLLLGLQHMFAMFGATILVPILVNTYFEGQGLSVQDLVHCSSMPALSLRCRLSLVLPLLFWVDLRRLRI